MTLVHQWDTGANILDFSESDPTQPGYHIVDQSWIPGIPVKRVGLTGNRSSFEDVIESYDIMIVGVDADDVFTKLEELMAALDQAQRWKDARGSGVDPVIFKYRPAGSTMTDPLESAIMGPPNGSPGLNVPARLELVDGNSHLGPIGVSFVHRVGLGPEETAVSSAANNPAVLTATFTDDALVPSPTQLKMTNFTGQRQGGSFLLLSDDGSKIDAFTMQGATATNFTAVNDAARLPLHGTNVLRFTPPDTSWHETAATDIKSRLLTDTKDILIFVNARRNSATMEAQLKAKLEISNPGYAMLSPIETDPTPIVETKPQWLFLGEIEAPVEYTDVTAINLKLAVKTSGTTSTVDIDAVAIIDARSGRVLFFPSSNTDGLWITLNIDHRELTRPNPSTYLDSSGPFMNVPTQGDQYIEMLGDEVAAMWLATNYASTTGLDYWAGVSSAGIKLSNTLTAVRRKAYLTPK